MVKVDRHALGSVVALVCVVVVVVAAAAAAAACKQVGLNS